MSLLNSAPFPATAPARPRRRRSGLLATAAAAALLGQAVLGGTPFAPVPPAGAAAVVTSDLRLDAVPSFATVVERVKPAVVQVKVEIGATPVGDAAGNPGLDGLPPQIQEFLRRFGAPSAGRGQAHAAPSQALGSGFFVSADGFVVTNNHVVENARSVSVTTDAGATLKAHVVGTDPKTDLALLKVEGGSDFPFVSLAHQSPKLGEWVVAIGNPYGLGGTVTAGIVSATGRDIGAGPYDNFLQIDAPINKGNSGGPTFNLKGEVVGVNTAIFSPSGGNIGLAFAIPASTVDTVVSALEHDGRVARGYMGVRIQAVSPDIAEGLGLKSDKGALVAQAEPDSPALRAGLRSGDVILSLNGHDLADARDLSRQVGALKPGDTVSLRYLRDGHERSAEVRLAAQAPEQTARAAQAATAPDDGTVAALGMQLAPASEVQGAGDEGVVVVGVDPEGPAAARGLSGGDVILEVAGHKVASADDVRAGLDAARHAGRKALLMKLRTAEGPRFVALAFPKA